MCLQGNLSRLQIRPHTDAVNALQQWLPAEKSNSEEWCYCSRRPVFLRVSESDSLVMGGLIAAHFLSYLTSHMGLFKISVSLLSLSGVSLEGTVHVGCVWCQNRKKFSFILNTLNYCLFNWIHTIFLTETKVNRVMWYAKEQMPPGPLQNHTPPATVCPPYYCLPCRWTTEQLLSSETPRLFPHTPS